MSERIDVLKVLNRAAIRLDNGHGVESMNLAIEVTEARAAVAELVEAAAACVEHGNREVVTPGAAAVRVARLRTALARIAPNELHDKAAELRGRGE